jgi:hypothetical protein
MDRELKLRGGRAGSLMLHHPIGAAIGAVVLGAPAAWIAQGAESSLAAGVLMGLVGLVMGAPLGAMLADSGSQSPS